MRNARAISPAAGELVRELRRSAAPWRRRALQELALLALALSLALASCAWWSPALAALLGAVALGGTARELRRSTERSWSEIERRLACDGALGAALECAHEAPLGALAARDLVRRLRLATFPATLSVRPACWLVLGGALFAAAATLGVATERERQGAALLALAASEALADTSAASSAAKDASSEAELAREAAALRAQRDAGALEGAEFAERMERLSKSYARPRADSSMSRPATAADASQRGAHGGSDASAPGAATGPAADASSSGAGGAHAGNTAWAELPERYRRCVARYFGRRD
ncbi:MAG: hypothetical protein IPN34_09185 [Planctomycetes bacterium]|nr:hypothetical protein [Planctomycetota bacterium]